MKSFRYLLPVLLLPVFLLLSGEACGQSRNMDLFQNFVPVSVDKAGTNSSLWGYAAPDGKEYAICGTGDGAYIVNITTRPLRTVTYIKGPSSEWREIKVYKHYAYIVTESSDSGAGLQIVDLSTLPDSAHLIRTDSTNFIRAHTIYIRDHYLYVNGTQAAAGVNQGVMICDLEPDPTHPVKVGKVDPYYYHDSFARNDTLLGAAVYGQGCDIWNISNLAKPVKMGSITYPYAGTHNAELTEDGHYVYTTDEIGFTPKTLKVWDIRDMENISKVAEYTPNLGDIVHNVHIIGRYAYVAWYTAGVRILDIIDPVHPREVAFYDTYPGTSGGYDGVWEVYGNLPSGKVIAMDRQTGLYVFTWKKGVGGSVSGVVRDSSGGYPLGNAIITIPEQGKSYTADGSGNYYIPGVVGDTVTLAVNEFLHGGYKRTVILTGDLTQDILLSDLNQATVQVKAQDTLGTPIPDFQYAVEPYLPAVDAQHSSGAILAIDSTYTLEAGKWGYNQEKVAVTPTAVTQDITVTLHSRYHDDFTLDLGWKTSDTSDHSISGHWTRIQPYLGYIGSGWIHPAKEPQGTDGFTYMTGAPPVNAPPQNNDVNNGTVTLTSPLMDLRGTDPVVNFDLWFYESSQTAIVDTFQVDVSNDAGSTWVRAYSEINGRGGWFMRSFYPKDLLPLTDKMLVRFRGRDSSGQTLFFAAVDNFDVGKTRTDSDIRTGGSGTDASGIQLLVYPNPMGSDGSILVNANANTRHARLEIFNALGERVQLLNDGPLTSGQTIYHPAVTLASGWYVLRATTENGVKSVKFEVVR